MSNIDNPNYFDEGAVNTYLISVCCGAFPHGEVSNDDPPSGICSKCHDNTTFELSEE
jgi:hypothetical protein